MIGRRFLKFISMESLRVFLLLLITPGGLDIVKELDQSNELQNMIPVAEDLNSRIARLTKSSPVVVFMKGTRTMPKCGFSRQLVAILNGQGYMAFSFSYVCRISYETFDILSDESIRQGLKTFSSWPTFPQLYVNGEFMGGLDIIKEMVELGEPIL